MFETSMDIFESFLSIIVFKLTGNLISKIVFPYTDDIKLTSPPIALAIS